MKMKMRVLGILSKKYYVPKVEVEDFNLLIDGNSFFEIPLKNKEEAYKQLLK